MENMVFVSSMIIVGNIVVNVSVDLVGMGLFFFDGYNFIGIDGSGFFMVMFIDIVGMEMMLVDVNLDVLVDNGGGIMIYVIMCFSLVIDVGDLDNGENDQCGLMVFGDCRDIGVYEYQEECIIFICEVFVLQ